MLPWAHGRGGVGDNILGQRAKVKVTGIKHKTRCKLRQRV